MNFHRSDRCRMLQRCRVQPVHVAAALPKPLAFGFVAFLAFLWVRTKHNTVG
jgi:hypothetical protein